MCDMAICRVVFAILCVFSLFHTTYAKPQHGSDTKKEPAIAIIGAGISGLAAADQLINKHKLKNVIILEALNRVGGRIHPAPFGDGTGYIQMGAQWIHDRHNPVFEMALKLGLLPNADVEPDDFFGEMRFIDQNACDVPRRLLKDFRRFAGRAFLESEDWSEKYNSTWSYGDIMDQLYQRFLANHSGQYNASDIKIWDAMFRTSRTSIEQHFAAEDWHLISINENDDSDETDEDDRPNRTRNSSDDGPIALSMSKDGYKTILNEMTRRVPPSKYIEFNRRVQHIRWNNRDSLDNDSRTIDIELMGGGIVSVDHVIVTCSLGHLKDYAQLLFVPPLPKRKLDTIQALGFDAVDKLWLSFDKPYWSNETFDVNFIRVDKDAKISNCSSTTPLLESELTRMMENFIATQTPPLLLVWIGSRDPPVFENATDTEVASAAASVVRKFLNNPLIPVPRIFRSAWKSNPLFRGSYSYNSMACQKIKYCHRKTLMEPLTVVRQNREVPMVLFAGEATHPEHYATVHGAFMSGTREADRIAKFYGI